MLLGDDVVDWEREEWIFIFVNAAVFAPPARSLPNLGSEPSVHHAAPFWPTILRALACKIAMNVPAETHDSYSSRSSSDSVP